MKKMTLIFLLITSFASGQFVINSYQYAEACSNPFYTHANGANECDEANAITDFAENGTSFTTTTVESTDVHDGTYAISIENTSGLQNNTFSVRTAITGLTIGVTYEVRVWVNRIAGTDNWVTRLDSSNGWVATDSEIKPPLQTWREEVMVAEADATTAYLSFGHDSGNDDGDRLIVDNIRVTAQ